jgi:hypothetical protein
MTLVTPARLFWTRARSQGGLLFRALPGGKSLDQGSLDFDDRAYRASFKMLG